MLDYYDIITTPMDFSTIATQLDSGSYKNDGTGAGPLRFVTDVRQGLILVHISAQPEPVSDTKCTLDTP